MSQKICYSAPGHGPTGSWMRMAASVPDCFRVADHPRVMTNGSASNSLYERRIRVGTL